MLLGCCHCGPEQPQSSFMPPSVNTPSILSPSESGTSIIGGQPGFCGACYNLPGRWKFGVKGAWFVWNPNITTWWNIVDCPMISSYTYHTLFSHPISGVYDGMTYGAHSKTTAELMPTPCAVWRSDTQATELSDNGCGTTDPEFELCAPNKYGIPMLEAVAFDVGGGAPTSTQFYVFLWWSICGTQLGYYWKWNVTRQTPPYSVSCVRAFGADFAGSAGYDIFGMPYTMSGTDVSWGTATIEPV